MADGVFISWAGSRGKVLAQHLYDALDETFHAYGLSADIKFSPVSQQIGSAWRQQLEDALQASKFGILLLDPAALRSFWVAFETGYFAANDARLFPLVLAESLDPVRGTLFESVQCAVLSPHDMEQLFRALSSAMADFLEESAIPPLAESCYTRLVDAWKDIQAVERETGDGLSAAFKRVIADYRGFALIDEASAKNFANLLGTSRMRFPMLQTSLFAELSAISALFDECISQENCDFGEMAATWALKNLIIDARERLRDVTHGRLSIRNRAPVREFWLNSVFGRATTSIWTTNVAKPGANMGGALDRNLLDAQDVAIKRGVSVTRLFVYSPEMGSDEAEHRRMLIRRQIDIGIDVRVITHADFRIKADAENATRRIGSDDFMIIDDEYLYLTFPDENDDIEAILLDGRRHFRNIEAARAFKTVLESWADVVTSENIERFPHLPM